MIRILQGDCREVLKTLPDNSVHCCITSPPYMGLRDYGTATWDGGDPECDHKAKSRFDYTLNAGLGPTGVQTQSSNAGSNGVAQFRDTCGKCGARRIDAQIGLEQSPEEYVAQMVAVFREVRRVLRDDGTCWVNLGSSYASKRIESDRHIIRRDLLNATRSKVAKAMSSVWSGHASPEQALQALSLSFYGEAGELSNGGMPQVRQSVQGSYLSEADLLLGLVRKVGQSDAQENNPSSPVHCMRETSEAVAIANPKEEDEHSLLLDGMLVSAQCAGASLPLGRWPTSEDERDCQRVEKSSARAGSQVLPVMLLGSKAGGSSHPSISQPPREAVGAIEWDNGLPEVSSTDGTRRDELCAHSDGGNGNTPELLAGITFTRASIPAGFEQWCEPESVIKPKDDLAIPETVALALREDGWLLRSRIIWQKPNPMPESVTDRPTSAHEHVFLLTKSARYFYDADAVREPITEATVERYSAGYNASWKRAQLASISDERTDGFCGTPDASRGRNMRNVWTIATAPYPAAHFATFPPELAERCIRAGTSECGCCANCGSPWVRVVETERQKDTTRHTGRAAVGNGNRMDGAWPRMIAIVTTTGWAPSCQCNALAAPCTVIDPFGGAGTTGLVASRLRRDAILIELNADYVAMAQKRIDSDMLVRQGDMFMDAVPVDELVST